MSEMTVMNFVDPERTGHCREIDGPWQNEPDKAQWLAADLDCLAVRNHFGAWCGYVGVPPGHPYHGVGYGEIDYELLDVHGGLTFSALCAPGEPVDGICHVALPGRPANVWWLGFDCGHAFDLQPGMVATFKKIGHEYPMHSDLPAEFRDTYRPFAYVVDETSRLADQLAKLARSV